jgi:hypothetical protein
MFDHFEIDVGIREHWQNHLPKVPLRLDRPMTRIGVLGPIRFGRRVRSSDVIRSKWLWYPQPVKTHPAKRPTPRSFPPFLPSITE